MPRSRSPPQPNTTQSRPSTWGLTAAKACATTAVFQGVSSAAFEHHFWPVCQSISRDNSIGKATFAALSILVAHAIFKAALFMVVGEVDVRAKTRDITKLSGLARSMPIAFTVALVSALSMAGVPPLLGFPAKEAAIEIANRGSLCTPPKWTRTRMAFLNA